MKKTYLPLEFATPTFLAKAGLDFCCITLTFHSSAIRTVASVLEPSTIMTSMEEKLCPRMLSKQRARVAAELKVGIITETSGPSTIVLILLTRHVIGTEETSTLSMQAEFSIPSES
jgi:hypothetical protein